MRKVIAISLAVFLFLALFLASSYSVSYYRRWQASQLLAVVSQLRPGTTTEAQTRALLKPFANYEIASRLLSGDRDDSQIDFEFANYSKWFPMPFGFRWTLFTVNIQFVDGLLAHIHLVEMQEDHRGYPHPNSASVDIYSRRLSTPLSDFTGYSESSRSTAGVDSQDNWTSFKCCYARFIKLDERATPDQRSRSLDFRLSCMTSFIRCKNDREILP